MKSTASRTSYPILTKSNGSQSLETHFRDDNLRDPLHSSGNIILEDLSAPNSTLRHGSETFDNAPRLGTSERNQPEAGVNRTLGVSKSQTTLHSFQKQKKLKPLGKSTELSQRLAQTNNGFKQDYGVSDFYLKNFLGRQNADIETRRILSVNPTQSNLLENITMRSSTQDMRKAKSPLKQVATDLGNFAGGHAPKQKFYDILGVSYKEFFMDKKEFMKVFDDIDVATFCLEEVVERLKCYRFELGTILDKVGYSYKKIMEKLLELTMKISSEKDLIHEKKMEENFQGIKMLENEKKALEEKNKQYKNLSDVTESEANIYKFNVKSLQNEVSMLYELLKKDYLVQDRPNEDAHDDLAELRPIKPKDGAEHSKMLEKNLLTLQESIKNLESEQKTKEERLQEMNNLLKAMLRGGKKEVSTQVDEGELSWTAKNIVNLEGLRPRALDFENHETGVINMDPLLNTELAKDDTAEGVDPIHVLKFKEKMERKETEEAAQPEEAPKKVVGKNANAAAPPAVANNNNNNGLTGQIVSDNWNLPLTMIVFLENATKANKTANVLPWPFFKRIIYDIYQDKIINTVEIQHALINTSLTISEYLPLYFLKTYRLRRTAEMKLLEFGVSLKYYVKTWQRAATFANVCNISNIRLEKEGSTATTVPEFDIYAQNFFFFAFTKATADHAHTYDHPDGTSYLAKDKAEELSNDILSFENEANRKKFIANLPKFYKSYTENGKEAEGIDVDRLLNLFMEIYFEVKTRNTQLLTKYFYKQQNTGEGVFSLDEVLQMVSDIIDIESPVPGYIYPKELSVCRAFLYSLTSGKNAFSMAYKDFMKGVARFGIDCPFPFMNVSSAVMFAPNAAGSLVLAEDKSGVKKNASGVADKKLKPQASFAGKNIQNLKVETPKKTMEEEGSSTGSVKMPGLASAETKDVKKKKEEEKTANFKIDSASTLFAQHFSILRELKGYCSQFKDMMGKESDIQKVWKGFEQIAVALDAGCQFLSYPVTM